MKKTTGLLICILLLHYFATAQSFAINTDGAAAHASAILDVKSINKGILIPRLTTAQRTSIASPGKGLLVYDSTLKNFYFHDGIVWQQINADSNNLWRKNGNDIYNSNTGNVGIGTATPLSTLHVKRGAVLFDGVLYDNTIGTTPVSGSGTRMMWIPEKGAFRAGTISFTGWDDVNIGYNSTAMGYGTIASGHYSTAIGRGGLASGDYSTAMGQGSVASGDYSTAMGNGTTASGDYSTAMGWGSVASGNNSTATGYWNKSKSYGGFVIGHYNDTAIAADPLNINSLNRIFQIGNGIAHSARSNAVTVLQNGNVGVGTTTPLSILHVKRGAVLFDSTIGSTPVSGAGTRMMWIPAKAAFRGGRVDGNYWDEASIGWGSFAFGHNSKASDSLTTTFGDGALASGPVATAMGFYTIASGEVSTAMGSYTVASGPVSTAMGVGTIASGNLSTAMGYGTTSKSYAGFVTGILNDSTNAASSTTIHPLNRIFQIGNGTDGYTRRNAVTVLQNGNVGVGTTTPQSILHVKRGAVLFDSTIGNTPVSGAGTRMMWIPAKGAFRGGRVEGGYSNYWDEDSIGWGSFAFGYNSNATGANSVCLGLGSYAAGSNSVSIGQFTKAYGSSTAFGSNTLASGFHSTALGINTIASGNESIAMGANNTASGSNSFAAGNLNVSSGIHSVSMGSGSIASGDNSFASGAANSAKSYCSFVVGHFNDNTLSGSPSLMQPLNRLFEIGNGTTDIARRNALTVLQNGNIGIGELIPTSPLNFASTLGDKIALWGNGANHYGLGIQASLMQVYTMDAGNDIAFGYGSSSAFTENVRIKGNGNVGIGTVNPVVPLNFSTNLGDKIALWSNGTNHYGIGLQPSLLQLFTEASSSDIAFGYGNSAAFTENLRIKGNGNVGIGTNAPAELLDVNGTTTTNGLQVSNGTVITKMQSGSVTVGANVTGQLVYVINFPVAFATASPRVFATARNAPATNFNDAFSVSVRSVSANSVTLNIQRTDSNAGWGQILRVDWFAVE